MLVFPYIIGHLGPAAEFRCVGVLAFAWLALWSQVGSDRPDGSTTANGNHKIPPGESNSSNGSGSSGGGWAAGGEDTDSLIPRMEDLPQPTLMRGSSTSHTRSTSGHLRSPSPPLETKISIVAVNGPAAGGSGGGARAAAVTASIPWWAMLKSPAVWAIVSSNFAFHYAVYVLMNWLPTFYENHLNVSLLEMGNVFKVSRSVNESCFLFTYIPKLFHICFGTAHTSLPQFLLMETQT